MGPKILTLKEAYLANREAKLKEWDTEIMQLEAKAEQAQAQRKIQIYKHLESLRTKHTTVRDRLHELQQTSGAAWETINLGLETAWNDLKGGLTSAAAKFN